MEREPWEKRSLEFYYFLGKNNDTASCYILSDNQQTEETSLRKQK